MCHNLWQKSACLHKGSYIRYEHCKYFNNTLEILAQVKTINLERQIKINERSCKLDRAREEFQVTNGLCRLCKAGLMATAGKAALKREVTEAREVFGGGGVSAVSD